MTDCNDDTSLTEITVADPFVEQQNELIAQMMQQIVDMKTEMKRTRELANLAITANLPGPDHERPPVHFPSPDLLSLSPEICQSPLFKLLLSST